MKGTVHRGIGGLSWGEGCGVGELGFRLRGEYFGASGGVGLGFRV